MTPRKIVSANGKTYYQVHKRAPDGTMPKRRFPTRQVAVTYEASLAVSTPATNVDTRKQRITFRVQGEQFWEAHHHEMQRTRRDRASGSTSIDTSSPCWVLGSLARCARRRLAPPSPPGRRPAPGTVGQLLKLVRQILDVAVSDGLVPTNVAKDRSVRMPKGAATSVGGPNGRPGRRARARRR